MALPLFRFRSFLQFHLTSRLSSYSHTQYGPVGIPSTSLLISSSPPLVSGCPLTAPMHFDSRLPGQLVGEACGATTCYLWFLIRGGSWSNTAYLIPLSGWLWGWGQMRLCLLGYHLVWVKESFENDPLQKNVHSLDFAYNFRGVCPELQNSFHRSTNHPLHSRL